MKNTINFKKPKVLFFDINETILDLNLLRTEINNLFGQDIFDLWKIQCKLPPKTKRFCPLKTFNNAPLKSLDRWGYYYFRFFSV